MSVVNAITGAVTDGGFRVKGTVDSTPTSARLAVADNVGLTSPVYFTATVAGTVLSGEATGLAPDTQYYWAWEVDSVLDTSVTGAARTFGTAGNPYSFTFTCSSCGGLNPDYPGRIGPAPDRVSDHPVYDDIRLVKSRFNIQDGDLHYGDIGSGNHGLTNPSIDTYRAMYDSVLATRQGRLYRDVPLVHVWDDHDYGPGNSDRTAPLRAEAAQAYRERIPSYDLPASDGGGVYHAFTVGRVQFVVLDTRYYRDPLTDPAPRALLGSAQKTWLDSLLGTSTSELLFVVESQRWNNTGTKTNIGSYSQERDDLVAMFGDHAWLDRMAMLSGDVHGSGICTGGGNDFGGFPLFQGGSLDSSPAPYGNGHGMDLGWSSARGQYLTVDVTDAGRYVHADCKVWRH